MNDLVHIYCTGPIINRSDLDQSKERDKSIPIHLQNNKEKKLW